MALAANSRSCDAATRDEAARGSAPDEENSNPGDADEGPAFCAEGQAQRQRQKQVRKAGPPRITPASKLAGRFAKDDKVGVGTPRWHGFSRDVTVAPSFKL